MPGYPHAAPRNDPEYVAYLEQRIASLEARLPQTKVVSPSFFARAFAIWGHYFVAQFIIGVVLGAVATLLGIVFAGSMAALLAPMLESMGTY